MLETVRLVERPSGAFRGHCTGSTNLKEDCIHVAEFGAVKNDSSVGKYRSW